ncbi:hypothetical protein NHX12_019657, partial [Muraenolepis orangiensis]
SGHSLHLLEQVHRKKKTNKRYFLFWRRWIPIYILPGGGAQDLKAGILGSAQVRLRVGRLVKVRTGVMSHPIPASPLDVVTVATVTSQNLPALHTSARRCTQ